MIYITIIVGVLILGIYMSMESDKAKVKSIVRGLTSLEKIRELEKKIYAFENKIYRTDKALEDAEFKIHPYLEAFKEVEHLASYNLDGYTEKEKMLLLIVG